MEIITKNRTSLLGYKLDNLTENETVDVIEKFVNEKIPHQHVVLNAAKIVNCYNDEKLKQIINDCDLINVDGQAVVWAARFLGIPLKERVAGVDLMVRLIAESEKKGWRVYFLGAKENVLQMMVEKLKIEYPNLFIAGFRNGYFKKDEEEIIASHIKESKTDLLFVGISSPKKEEFLGEYLGMMNVPFAMGVGGSFDVVAGITKRAPIWMQKAGMEWFYRIYQEPGRMWKRYAKTNPLFVYMVLKEKIRMVLN